LFVGSMDYHANVDGVTHFAQATWPAIHAKKPGLVFTIVGRSPGAAVRALAELPAIEVTGTVEDVRPYYREAVVAIVPLRIGGGSRLKILEAMAAGVPVVSTSLGAEGLAVNNGRDVLLADAPGEFSRAVLDMIEDGPARDKLVTAARALVHTRYDWSTIGQGLFDLYERLTDRGRCRSHRCDEDRCLIPDLPRCEQ
jgi:glycosyltransferase involved in cell wall biosynthesis